MQLKNECFAGKEQRKEISNIALELSFTQREKMILVANTRLSMLNY
jgi:hypothetical protein